MHPLRLLLPFAFALAASAEEPAPGVDYKVVAWYDRAHPIDSFRYQAYDVRKGEFTPAVEAWLGMMGERYTNYKVVVRDVDLAREQGQTERRKVGAAIYRELLAAAAAEGVFLGPSVGDMVGKAPRTVPMRSIAGPLPGLPSAPLIFQQNPEPAGFPVPMPYPRPHPGGAGAVDAGWVFSANRWFASGLAARSTPQRPSAGPGLQADGWARRRL